MPPNLYQGPPLIALLFQFPIVDRAFPNSGPKNHASYARFFLTHPLVMSSLELPAPRKTPKSSTVTDVAFFLF